MLQQADKGVTILRFVYAEDGLINVDDIGEFAQIRKGIESIEFYILICLRILRDHSNIKMVPNFNICEINILNLSLS
jgi:hypothetical protein